MRKMRSKMRSSAAATSGFGVALATVVLIALPPPAGAAFGGMTLRVIHEHQGQSFAGAGEQGASPRDGGAQFLGQNARGGDEPRAVDLGTLTIRAVRLAGGVSLPADRE
jgi:hypothetical protein